MNNWLVSNIDRAFWFVFGCICGALWCLIIQLVF